MIRVGNLIIGFSIESIVFCDWKIDLLRVDLLMDRNDSLTVDLFKRSTRAIRSRSIFLKIENIERSKIKKSNSQPWFFFINRIFDVFAPKLAFGSVFMQKNTCFFHVGKINIYWFFVTSSLNLFKNQLPMQSRMQCSWSDHLILMHVVCKKKILSCE